MILIKEEFVGGEKWRRAVELGGSDAIVLWLAMKRYCSHHTDTEGFVPDEDLEGLPGAPRRLRKALQVLIDCGRRLPCGQRGPGFVEPVEGGWRLHDYLEHSAAPEEIALKREKERIRKNAYRESKRRELDAVRRFASELGTGEPAGHVPHVPWDSPTESDGTGEADVPRDTLAGAGPPEGARVHAPAHAGAHPNPSQPNPTKNLRGLTSTIREPPSELGAPIEVSPAHRRLAADHGLDVEELVEQLRSELGDACLSKDEIRARLSGALMTAIDLRRVGGAA